MSIEIERLIRALNSAWQEGDLDKLSSFYHPDVVLLPPDSGAPIIGRGAVLDTYRTFLEQTELHAFSETDLITFEFPDTAIAHMGFAVEFTIDSQRLLDTGFEVYVVARSDMQVIWRSQTILGTENRD